MLAYTIPDFAAGEGFQFQIRAKDKAGNYGVGYSKVIMVNGYQGPGPEQPAGQAEKQAGNSPTTQPAETEHMAASASPKPDNISPRPVQREMSAVQTEIID